jgi:Flp pilus assembly protein TadG
LVSALRRIGVATAVDSGGAAAVEFAIIAPVLLLMIAGMIDYSFYIGTRIELEQALRAGAQYALKDYKDSVTIVAAVKNATDLAPVTVNYNPATDSFCECPDGTANLCPGNSSYTPCAGGERPGLFITISGSTTFDPMFADLPTLAANMTVSQQLTLRVR